MAFRVAASLLALRDEINAAAPGRRKASDGTIGDADHQSRKSDHNPDQQGVVRAMDITHDPDRGADMHELAERLRRQRDARLKYVIFDRKSFSPRTGFEWKKFTGENPHTAHLHISVVADAIADDRSGWGVGTSGRLKHEEDEDMRYKLFKAKGFFDVLAVGPGNPFNPGSPAAAQELVDKDLVADAGGSPVRPGTAFEGVRIEISVDLWTAMNAGRGPVATRNPG